MASKTVVLHVRVDEKTYAEFRRKSFARNMDPNDTLRELIGAFAGQGGTVVITPDSYKKELTDAGN